VYAFTRRHAGTELLVLGNFSRATVTADVPAEWAGAELLLSNYADAPGDLSLRPWEARIHTRAV
jgi:oligo-1,6-glucosidase